MNNKLKSIVAGVLCIATLLGTASGCGKDGNSSETDSMGSKTESSSSTFGGFGSRLKLTNPSNGYLYGENLEVTWSGGKEGQTFTVKLEKQNGNDYSTVFEKSGLSGTSYKYSEKLENAYYRISLRATGSDGSVKEAVNAKDGGLVFRCIASTNKSLNDGINYKFDKKISEEVLNNYLNRAMTYSIYDGMGGQFNEDEIDESYRAILSVGAKYVPRHISIFYPSANDEKYYHQLSEKIKQAHVVDPDIIFEACIFECVSDLVDTIKIPDYVFEAFGKKKTSRSFESTKMFFKNGYGKDVHGAGAGYPDITQEETQMFFYYRATQYIDMGIESLHMGIMTAIGKSDTGNKCWEKVISMIREYAAKNARRHYIIINGHSGNVFTGSNGSMLVDFIASPSRLQVADGQTNHAASEGNPQKADIYPNRDYSWGKYDAPYQSNIKGTSPSGWTTKHYPYLVELDNWGTVASNDLTVATNLWNGYDEISWYANQPDSYRHEFLYYITKKIKDYKENGHFAMPGTRIVYMINQKKEIRYRMNSKKNCAEGFGDEDAIIAAWSKNK